MKYESMREAGDKFPMEFTDEWLKVNSEAIDGTTQLGEGRAFDARLGDGHRVRYTCRGDTVYAIVYDPDPEPRVVMLQGFGPWPYARTTILGMEGEVPIIAGEHAVRVALPENVPQGSAYVVRFEQGLKKRDQE